VPALRQQFEALGASGSFESYRLELATEPTERRVFLLNARRIEGSSLVLLALDDVTSVERAAEAVQRTEHGFREMLTTATEAIVMSDAAGHIVFANHAAEAMFGYAALELLGMEAQALVPEAERTGCELDRAAYLAAPSARPMARSGNRLRRRKDGREFPVEIVLGSMQTETGPLVVSFITDISERLAAQRAIADYQQKLHPWPSMPRSPKSASGAELRPICMIALANP